MPGPLSNIKINREELKTESDAFIKEIGDIRESYKGKREEFRGGVGRLQEASSIVTDKYVKDMTYDMDWFKVQKGQSYEVEEEIGLEHEVHDDDVSIDETIQKVKDSTVKLRQSA